MTLSPVVSLVLVGFDPDNVQNLTSDHNIGHTKAEQVVTAQGAINRQREQRAVAGRACLHKRRFDGLHLFIGERGLLPEALVFVPCWGVHKGVINFCFLDIVRISRSLANRDMKKALIYRAFLESGTSAFSQKRKLLTSVRSTCRSVSLYACGHVRDTCVAKYLIDSRHAVLSLLDPNIREFLGNNLMIKGFTL